MKLDCKARITAVKESSEESEGGRIKQVNRVNRRVLIGVARKAAE